MAEPRRATLAGLAVMAVILVLVSVNLVWVLRHCQELRPVTSGRAAPLFTLRRVDGGEERLAAHRGEVVLISFWASWCGPCLRELPLLAALQEQHADQGFTVLAINVEGEAAKVKQVRRSHAAARKLTTLLDDGTTGQRYGVQTLPHLVVVGRDGDVANVHVGAGGVERLKAAVEQALQQKR